MPLLTSLQAAPAKPGVSKLPLARFTAVGQFAIAGSTVQVNELLVTLVWAASVTVTEVVDVPADVTVPLITPVLLMVSPVGALLRW